VVLRARSGRQRPRQSLLAERHVPPGAPPYAPPSLSSPSAPRVLPRLGRDRFPMLRMKAPAPKGDGQEGPRGRRQRSGLPRRLEPKPSLVTWLACRGGRRRRRLSTGRRGPPARSPANVPVARLPETARRGSSCSLIDRAGSRGRYGRESVDAVRPPDGESPGGRDQSDLRVVSPRRVGHPWSRHRRSVSDGERRFHLGETPIRLVQAEPSAYLFRLGPAMTLRGH
jgi:hypothetical protein